MDSSLRPAVVALIGCLCLWTGAAGAQELRLAAASDLQVVMPAIAERFEHETGQRVSLTFGSSGNFFSQIQNGAPFDLFFSADIEYPRQLEAAHLAAPNTLYQYAVGRIVLWSRKDSGIDVRRGLQVLTEPGVRRVAVANPDHAPYGRAAVAALRHEQLLTRVQPKFVLGENISQTAQFAQSGNAEAGIIALSLALTPALQAVGSYYEIPAAFHPAIAQAAVILQASSNKDVSRRFLAFFQRSDIADLLQRSGFSMPVAVKPAG